MLMYFFNIFIELFILNNLGKRTSNIAGIYHHTYVYEKLSYIEWENTLNVFG